MGKETWPKFYQRLILDNGTAFRGAHLKLLRADHLLEELEIAIRVLPQTIGKQFLIGTSDETVNITFLSDRMPLQLSAALGDCVVPGVRARRKKARPPAQATRLQPASCSP